MKSYELATPSVQRLSPPWCEWTCLGCGASEKRLRQASALGLSSKRAGSEAQAERRIAPMHTGHRPLQDPLSQAGAKGSQRRDFLDREVKGELGQWRQVE